MIKKSIHKLACFILLLSIAVMHSQGASWAAQGAQPKIWNAKKVDWWVSMDDQSQFGAKQGCEIHWLYDDALDVSLNVSSENRMYYGFEVLKKSGVSVPAINYNQAESAFLVVDKVKTPLAIARGDFSQVLMAPLDELNNVKFLKGAQRLLIKIGGTIYNFPLENADENFLHFKKCLDTLNIGLAAKAKPVMPKQSLAKVAAVEKQPLAPKVPTVASDLNMFPPVAQVEKKSMLDLEPPAFPEGEKVAVKPVVKHTKQFDSMLDDVQQSGVPKKGEAGKPDPDRSSSCSDGEYSSENTGIIRNLNKKLAVLEREKEALRVKMIGSSGSGILSDVAACNTPMEEDLNEPLSDEVIAKFEDTINKLRAENEVLREASLEVDANDAGALDDELEDMQQKVNDLLKANKGISDENDSLLNEIQELNDELMNRDQAVDNAGKNTPALPGLPTGPVAEKSALKDTPDVAGELDLEALKVEDAQIRDRLKDLTGLEVTPAVGTNPDNSNGL